MLHKINLIFADSIYELNFVSFILDYSVGKLFSCTVFNKKKNCPITPQRYKIDIAFNEILCEFAISRSGCENTVLCLSNKQVR